MVTLKLIRTPAKMLQFPKMSSGILYVAHTQVIRPKVFESDRILYTHEVDKLWFDFLKIERVDDRSNEKHITVRFESCSDFATFIFTWVPTNQLR